MFIHKIATLSIVAVVVGAVPHTPHTPTVPLNNDDGVAPFAYVPAPVPAVPAPLTNSQRLAMGLPVRPPTPHAPIEDKRQLPSGLPLPRRGLPSGLPLPRRQLPSGLPLPRRQLPSPLPVVGKRHGLPSLLPRQTFPVHYHGNVRVEFVQNNTVAGYVSNRLNAMNEYTLTNNATEAAHITFTADRFDTTPFNLVDKNPANPELVNIGAVIGPKSSSAYLTGNSANHAFLVGSDSTEPYAPPSAGRTTAYGGSARESSIWNIDSLTNQLIATWINPDSLATNSTILQVEDFFVLSSDPQALEESFGVEATEVSFYLEYTE